MLPSEYLDYLRADSGDLVAAATAAPEAPVPSCPDWDMAALVGHVGAVHRWVTEMLKSRAETRAPFPDRPTGGWDELIRWYEEGSAGLVGALAGIDPSQPVWNWRDRSPAPAGFWHRRMAHETAMHRWDAQLAAGASAAIGTALAADGIDELTGFVDGWLHRRPAEGLRGDLGIEATDAGLTWVLALCPDHVERIDGPGSGGDGGAADAADAVVTGEASDVLLWMTGRLSAADARIAVTGDRALVESWERSISFG